MGQAVANWGISALSASARLGHHSKGLQTDEAGEGHCPGVLSMASHSELLHGGLFPGLPVSSLSSGSHGGHLLVGTEARHPNVYECGLVKLLGAS